MRIAGATVPVPSPHALAMTRIGVGLAVLVKATDLADVLRRTAQDDLLQLALVPGVPAPGGGASLAIGALWVLAGLALVGGVFSRVAAGAVAASGAYLIAADQQLWGNHLYLIVLMTGLLAATRCEQALAIRRTAPGPLGGAVYLMMLQVTVVYTYAGLLKLNGEFLSGEVLAQFLRGGLIEIPDGWRTATVLGPLAALAALTEVVVGAGLWFPASRRLAALLGLGLHGSIVLLMVPLDELVPFALVMVSVYPLFFTAEGPNYPPAAPVAMSRAQE